MYLQGESLHFWNIGNQCSWHSGLFALWRGKSQGSHKTDFICPAHDVSPFLAVVFIVLSLLVACILFSGDAVLSELFGGVAPLIGYLCLHTDFIMSRTFQTSP